MPHLIPASVWSLVNFCENLIHDIIVMSSSPLQSLSLTLRNLLGRAEQLSLVTATTVPLWGHTVQLQFSKPYYKDIEKK